MNDLNRDEQTLENAFSLIIGEFLKGNLNTALVGMVSAFDGKNRVTVQPVVNRKYTGQDGKPLPPISDVPISFPGAGDYWLTFPIEKGTWVLLLCSQRSIDAWKNGDGQPNDPTTPRRFSMSDAIAIPGVVPFGSSFDVGGGLELRNKAGDVRIAIDGKVLTMTNGTGTIEIGDDGTANINGHLTVGA